MTSLSFHVVVKLQVAAVRTAASQPFATLSTVRRTSSAITATITPTSLDRTIICSISPTTTTTTFTATPWRKTNRFITITKRTYYNNTANFLGFEGLVCASRSKTNATRDFEVVWSELVNTLLHTSNYDGDDGENSRRKCAAISSCQFAFDTLKKALKADYALNTGFGQGMFMALQQCLVESGLAKEVIVNDVSVKLTHDDDEAELIVKENTNKKGSKPDKTTKLILLKSNAESDFVVGIITYCQMNMIAREDEQSIKGPLADGKSSNEVTDNAALPDGQHHCVCLLRKETATPYTVMDCFSAVEFNRNESLFPQDLLEYWPKENRGLVHPALSYTVQYVLKCHARRGYLPDYLPWAVMARRKMKKTKAKSKGARTKESKSQQPERRGPVSMIRWVSGAIQIPKACGGRFFYTVDDDDRQYRKSDISNTQQQQQQQSDPNDLGLSVYLDTLLFGLKTAIKVYDDLLMNAMHSTTTPAPVSASGKKLIIGNVELKDYSMVVASSIHGANPIDTGSTTDDVHCTVSQADLFRARLNVNSILEGVMEGEKVVFNANNHEDVDVLVKVSSTVAHGLLIQPTVAFLALNSVKRVTTLQRVLYAAILMDAGFITIMKDLSSTNAKGYKVLTPKEFNDRNMLWFLWQGYKALVADVLLPMASQSVVHPDIRPGFDVTANIMCKDCGEREPSLLLIDFESLVDLGRGFVPLKTTTTPSISVMKRDGTP